MEEAGLAAGADGAAGRAAGAAVVEPAADEAEAAGRAVAFETVLPAFLRASDTSRPAFFKSAALFLACSVALSNVSSGFLKGSSAFGSNTSFLSTPLISSWAVRNLAMNFPRVRAIAGSLSGPKIRKPNKRMRKSSNPPIPNNVIVLSFELHRQHAEGHGGDAQGEH